MADPKFHRGDVVRKKSGSMWQGTVCGAYSTTLTPEGYAVESSAHGGSVQIYPAAALELVVAKPADGVNGRSGGPVQLERWGRAKREGLVLLERMDDGYWTPWHIAQQALDAASGVLACDAIPGKLEAPSTDASETVSAIYRALSRGNNLDAQRLADQYLSAKHAAERAAAGDDFTGCRPPMTRIAGVSPGVLERAAKASAPGVTGTLKEKAE